MSDHLSLSFLQLCLNFPLKCIAVGEVSSLLVGKAMTLRIHVNIGLQKFSPMAGKIFEVLISKALVKLPEGRNILSDMQYGFH